MTTARVLGFGTVWTYHGFAFGFGGDIPVYTSACVYRRSLEVKCTVQPVRRVVACAVPVRSQVLLVILK